jgi:hypothetical protein
MPQSTITAPPVQLSKREVDMNIRVKATAIVLGRDTIDRTELLSSLSPASVFEPLL